MKQLLQNVLSGLFLFVFVCMSQAQYQMEFLNRGVVAIKRSGDNYITWRMLGTETNNVTYNIYRDNVKLNATPITTTTQYVDKTGAIASKYAISAIVNGVEGVKSVEVETWSTFYKVLSLNKPAGGTTPDGVVYDYSPNDATVADVDGDGEYEIIFKWYPSNAKDNAHDGYTGVTYIEAIKLNGTSLWRINLGINIRSGAHYVEMQAYDFDGDGKAEVALRTADGTIDGQGKVIGNASADYRSSVGRVLTGPEYLTMFNGETGAAVSTVNYVPGRGSVSSWGDGYGNRVDRFLSGVAHLGGSGNPSLLMCRGYYTRMVVAAWDFVNGQLQQRWVFDTDNNMNHLKGKGNHQISIADVDNDGKQEVVYGAVVIDDNGAVLNYNTWGHGDALHVGDFDLDNPGLEIFMPIETASSNPVDKRPGFVLRDGKSGNVLWQVFLDGDIGRGNCANIDSRYPGVECWAAGGAGLYDSKGKVIGNTPSGCNHSIWWDGDFTRELLDGTKLDDWNEAGNGGNNRMVTIYNYGNAASNNGTKSNPNLTADILGDWREEMIYRSASNDKLLIFTTNIETNHKLYTLMHDAQYRTAIAWQSTGYNQPPHPSFYIGEDMKLAPTPNIVLVGKSDCNGDVGGTAVLDGCSVCVGGKSVFKPCTGTVEAEMACSVDGVVLETTNQGYSGDGYVNSNNTFGAYVTWALNSNKTQNVTLSFRYANGGLSARDGEVVINGKKMGVIALPSTGSWSSWKTAAITVAMLQGANELKLQAVTVDGLANIDALSFSDGVSEGLCVVTNVSTSVSNLVEMYPNPVSSVLYFNQQVEWVLLNSFGIEINNGTSMSIDLEDEKPGVYFVKIEGGVYSIVKK